MVELKLRDLVSDAFQVAAENGYPIAGMGVKEIVLDMMTYHSDIETYDYFEVLAAVREYLGEEDYK
jgi:hypothetical protein